MKISTIIALFAGLVVVAARKRATMHEDFNVVDVTDDADVDYRNYLNVYHPAYKPDDYHLERLAKFHACRNEMINHDPDATGYSVGFTRFCHMTDAEVARQWNHMIGVPREADPNEKIFKYSQRDVRQTPASKDWRGTGAVTSVKDQGQCGSCYTFAGAAALEGQLFTQLGQSKNLSTQQYVDCAQGYAVSQSYIWVNNAWQLKASFVHQGSGNGGCNGGLPSYCYSYNNLTAPQVTWECYGYNSGTSQKPGTCNTATVGSCQVKQKATGYVAIASGDETGLQVAVANNGPIAVGIDATPLQRYTGGIIQASSCSKSANHAVTVVGYGTDSASGQAYWIVKNSWGANWGEKGYFRLQRGVNCCGVATNNCVYPTIK